ncbi:protein O-mannosyl-transferase family [uncultured Fibrella sp.]|uniref:protein O-mannosyl-transferase family n=1 Tax=uncultured Fibrella sp. TaxID=1284596 RepID=UPI0035CB9D76
MIVFLLLFVAYVGWLSARITRPSLIEWLLGSFLIYASSVILTGFVLSALYQTNHEWVWAFSVFITASAIGFSLRALAHQPIPYEPLSLIRSRWQVTSSWFGSLPTYLKVVFSVLFLTLFVLSITNLAIVLFTVPNEWDSMTGHLNRVVQYMQRGTMRHFGGTNWNIDTYPKSVCTLQIYGYLMTGRFENGFKIIHYLSYWTTIVAVFGIVQRIGALNKQARSTATLSASFLAALAMSLLPDFLMQEVTTETDIVLTAYLSVLLYMLFAYRASDNEADGASSKQRDNRYLYLAGIAFGVAYGHKVTFTLLLPSVFVIMIYTVFWSGPRSATSIAVTAARTGRLAAAIAVGVCLWMLPTGYLKNIQVFGHPIGPPTALRHQSVERAGSLRNLAEQGSRNVVRYVYDHVNLDGLRNTATGESINREMRKPAIWLEDRLHMRLDEETDFSIIPFTFQRKFVFYNANPYWGIIGFGLIIPLLVLTLLFVIRSTPHRYLGVAIVLHVLALSYSAPYDPFKGRYFTETGMLGSLFLGLLFLNPRLNLTLPGKPVLKAYVAFVLTIGCLSALGCVFLNIRALPFAWTTPDGVRFPSVFEADRIRVMTVGRPDTYLPYKRFDELVPDSATVALGTINDDYEYPLYGAHLSRRLLPINPFEKGVQPIPKEATYLFFSKNVIPPRPGDIRLGTDTAAAHSPYVVVPGEDYYLRKLK